MTLRGCSVTKASLQRHGGELYLSTSESLNIILLSIFCPYCIEPDWRLALTKRYDSCISVKSIKGPKLLELSPGHVTLVDLMVEVDLDGLSRKGLACQMAGSFRRSLFTFLSFQAHEDIKFISLRRESCGDKLLNES